MGEEVSDSKTKMVLFLELAASVGEIKGCGKGHHRVVRYHNISRERIVNIFFDLSCNVCILHMVVVLFFFLRKLKPSGQ